MNSYLFYRLMKTLYADQFFYLALDSQRKLFYFYFTKHSVQMSEEEYLATLQVYLQFLYLYKPKGAWGNMVDFGYVITPGIQKWINEHIFAAYAKIGLSRLALLPNEDFVPNLSIKQMVEYDTTGAFKTEYFTKEKKARDWLLSTIAETA